MKKILLLFVIVASNCSATFAQDDELNSPRITTEGKNVKISYGQPSIRKRVIFGKFVPYGQVWRTGTNEATEITFTKNAFFGGKPVKAGTYTLFSIPGAKDWTFILNSELKQWGAYKYNEIKGKDVLQIKVPSSVINKPVEKFTITLPPGKLVLEWDKTRVEVPIKS